MSLFTTYEEQFISSLQIINKNLQTLSQLSSNKKQIAINDIKSQLTQTQKNIKLMETQIAGLPAQSKFDHLRKIRQYRKDFDTCRKALFKAEETYVLDKNKQMLFGAQLQDFDGQKGKFIKQGQLLSDTTYKLKQGVRVINDTLLVGQDIGQQLNDHTGRLIANRQKMSGINKQLGRSEKIIKTMFLRIKRNKFTIAAIFGLIFLVVIIILGVHFNKKKNT